MKKMWKKCSKPVFSIISAVCLMLLIGLVGGLQWGQAITSGALIGAGLATAGFGLFAWLGGAME